MREIAGSEAHLKSEQKCQIAVAFLGPEKGWGECSAQKQAFQVPYGLILKVQQLKPLSHCMAALHVCRLA